jgi:hypothetical protein
LAISGLIHPFVRRWGSAVIIAAAAEEEEREEKLTLP